MKLSKKLVAVVLVCCVCMTISSCSNDLASNGEAVFDVMTQEDFNKYDEIITSVQVEWLGYGGYQHYFYPNESDKIYQIGIDGIPVLITKMNRITDEERHEGPYDGTVDVETWRENAKKAIDVCRYEQFWRNCVFVLLRTDGSDVNSAKGSHTDGLNLLLYESTQDCQKIIHTDWSVEEKLIELSRFGILAIPYVLEEIEKGNTEYEEYFRVIGLHLSTDVFADYMFNWKVQDRLERYDNMRLDARGRNFDYRVWLSENEEALNQLYEFLELHLTNYEPPTIIRYSNIFKSNDSY